MPPASSRPRQLSHRVETVAQRSKNEFPALPIGVVARCVEAARASARPALPDVRTYLDDVDRLARVDLAIARLADLATDVPVSA